MFCIAVLGLVAIHVYVMVIKSAMHNHPPQRFDLETKLHQNSKYLQYFEVL